ncbi:hypothetical protein [Photobacterium leiognathi]|uniref:hypothetical protein n=1 Tax=Photobacterium leiognathi TaxID=553611 RepID=UPI002981D1CC|nr:hypothetical protein [Photobacterium leiognathi]
MFLMAFLVALLLFLIKGTSENIKDKYDIRDKGEKEAIAVEKVDCFKDFKLANITYKLPNIQSEEDLPTVFNITYHSENVNTLGVTVTHNQEFLFTQGQIATSSTSTKLGDLYVDHAELSVRETTDGKTILAASFKDRFDSYMSCAVYELKLKDVIGADKITSATNNPNSKVTITVAK